MEWMKLWLWVSVWVFNTVHTESTPMDVTKVKQHFVSNSSKTHSSETEKHLVALSLSSIPEVPLTSHMMLALFNHNRQKPVQSSLISLHQFRLSSRPARLHTYLTLIIGYLCKRQEKSLQIKLEVVLLYPDNWSCGVRETHLIETHYSLWEQK